jgi:hypothetical protein
MSGTAGVPPAKGERRAVQKSQRYSAARSVGFSV